VLVAAERIVVDQVCRFFKRKILVEAKEILQKIHFQLFKQKKMKNRILEKVLKKRFLKKKINNL
jgi:hypothetical protein